MDYFESRSRDYLQRCQSGLWRHVKQTEFTAVMGLLEPRPGQSLMDVGCGPGFYAIPLEVDFGVRVLGVDSSPGMLRSLREAGVRTHFSPIEELQLDERFDLILMAGVLEFVANPDLAFEKAKDHLRAGGKLVVLFPRACLVGQIYRGFHELQGCPTFIRELRHYDKCAADRGFKIEVARVCTPISVVARFRLLP